MLINIFTGYRLRKFVDAVKPLVKSLQDKQIMDLLDEVDKIVQEEVDEELVKEMDRAKELSPKELLKNWLSYYDQIYVYRCVGHRDLIQLRILENELLERGMGKDMQKLAGGCQELPSPDEQVALPRYCESERQSLC